MRFSASSFLVTLAVTAVMILFMNLILTSHKGHKLFKADFIELFIVITVLRLLIPLEYSFTKTVTALNSVMNPVMTFLLRTEVYEVEVWKWFFLIWIIGAIISLMKMILSYITVENLYREIRNNGKEIGNIEDFPVIVSSSIHEPMIMTLHKVILLPEKELDKDQLNFVIKHEMLHIRNHDGLLKLIVNVLCCVYWWFIPMYFFKKDFQLFQEVRVDYMLTKECSNEEILDYANILISVKEKISDFSYKDICNCLVSENTSILTYRIDYLIEGTYRKKTSVFLMLLLTVLPFLTNCILFEPHYDSSKKIKDMYSENDMKSGYLIHHKDGVEQQLNIRNSTHDNQIKYENNRKVMLRI